MFKFTLLSKTHTQTHNDVSAHILDSWIDITEQSHHLSNKQKELFDAQLALIISGLESKIKVSGRNKTSLVIKNRIEYQ